MKTNQNSMFKQKKKHLLSFLNSATSAWVTRVQKREESAFILYLKCEKRMKYDAYTDVGLYVATICTYVCRIFAQELFVKYSIWYPAVSFIAIPASRAHNHRFRDVVELQGICMYMYMQTSRQEQKVTYREVVNVWGYQRQNNNNNNEGGAEI